MHKANAPLPQERQVKLAITEPLLADYFGFGVALAPCRLPTRLVQNPPPFPAGGERGQPHRGWNREDAPGRDIARILLRRGWKPSILTRGYGRSSKSEMIVRSPGEGPPRERPGNRR
jgi:hypothetical protein